MIRDSEAFKLQKNSTLDRDHLSVGRRCRGTNDIMVGIMVMMMMMIGMKTIINDDNNRMEVMLMKIQVVHHDASDKLFGYNTSSSMWQVPIFPPSQTIFRLTSIYHPPGRSPYSIYRKHFPSLHLKISNYH